MAVCNHRRGGREVDCSGLENRRGCKPSVGSNPTPSAKFDHGFDPRAGAIRREHSESEGRGPGRVIPAAAPTDSATLPIEAPKVNRPARHGPGQAACHRGSRVAPPAARPSPCRPRGPLALRHRARPRNFAAMAPPAGSITPARNGCRADDRGRVRMRAPPGTSAFTQMPAGRVDAGGGPRSSGTSCAAPGPRRCCIRSAVPTPPTRGVGRAAVARAGARH